MKKACNTYVRVCKSNGLYMWTGGRGFMGSVK